jgi:hypothetical protein
MTIIVKMPDKVAYIGRIKIFGPKRIKYGREVN